MSKQEITRLSALGKHEQALSAAFAADRDAAKHNTDAAWGAADRAWRLVAELDRAVTLATVLSRAV